MLQRCAYASNGLFVTVEMGFLCFLASKLFGVGVDLRRVDFAVVLEIVEFEVMCHRSELVRRRLSEYRLRERSAKSLGLRGTPVSGRKSDRGRGERRRGGERGRRCPSGASCPRPRARQKTPGIYPWILWCFAMTSTPAARVHRSSMGTSSSSSSSAYSSSSSSSSSCDEPVALLA